MKGLNKYLWGALFWPLAIVWSLIYGIIGGVIFKAIACFEDLTVLIRQDYNQWKRFPARSYKKYISIKKDLKKHKLDDTLGDDISVLTRLNKYCETNPFPFEAIKRAEQENEPLEKYFNSGKYEDELSYLEHHYQTQPFPFNLFVFSIISTLGMMPFRLIAGLVKGPKAALSNCTDYWHTHILKISPNEKIKKQFHELHHTHLSKQETLNIK